ncbi:MAG: gephyrin-like molybdotransferase Glp, partial [Anaerolineae bacterium]
MPESPYPMIPVADATQIILRHVAPLPPVTVPFFEALGLVLAEPVTAGEPMPPFAASAVDGYALIAADAGPRRVVGDQMAGYVAGLRVEAGTAVRVTTGAPVPPGADAVVMVEQTREQDGLLTLTAPVAAGSNIRPVGTDIEAGQQVLPAGTLLNPAEIGLLATVGQTTVQVHPRPKIGVMSTGDEILEPGRPLNPGQIPDANRFALMGAVRQAGGIPVNLGIVRDRQDALASTIRRGLAQADGLLTSGGVSMGRLDLVKPYLAEHGVLHFGRVNTKPG